MKDKDRDPWDDTFWQAHPEIAPRLSYIVWGYIIAAGGGFIMGVIIATVVWYAAR